MALIQVDTLIKSLREGQGLTQKKLCDGICSQDELSRIERGKRKPDWWTFERLMQRLGEDPQRYYTNYVSKSEKHIMDLHIQLKRLLNEETPSSDAEAELLIAKLEKDKAFKKREHKQFLLRQRATLAFNRGEYKTMIKLSEDALRVTKPNFDEDKINTYVLFYDEIKLIEQIAVAYFYEEKIENTISILKKLKDTVDKNFISRDKGSTDLSILYNLSKFVGLSEKYEEAIAFCDEGVILCKQNYDSHYLPLFLFNKSICLMRIGMKEEGINILKKVYALFFALDRLAELESIKIGLAEHFGLTVCLEFSCHSHPGEAKADLQ